MRLAGAAGDGGDQRAALVAQALAGLDARLSGAARRGVRAGVNAARRGAGAGSSANSCSASPGWVVCSTSSSRRALEQSTSKPPAPRRARAARRPPRPRPAEIERVAALLLDLRGERLQPRVGGRKQVAHLPLRARGCGARSGRPPGGRTARCARRSRRRRRAAAGCRRPRRPSAPTRASAARRRRTRDPRRAPRLVAHHDLRLLAGDPASRVGEPPARAPCRSRPRARRPRGARRRARGQARVGVAQHLAHPVAVRVERGAQPPRRLGLRQHDVEVGAAPAAVAAPTPSRRRRAGT